MPDIELTRKLFLELDISWNEAEIEAAGFKPVIVTPKEGEQP